MDLKISSIEKFFPSDIKRTDFNLQNSAVSSAVESSSNYRGILDLIDCMQKPPPQITTQYAAIVDRALSFISGGKKYVGDLTSQGSKEAWSDSQYPEQDTASSSVSSQSPQFYSDSPDSQEKMRNGVNKGRNEVFDFMNRIMSFISRAKNAGFVPPVNPCTLLMTYNVGRVGFENVNLKLEDASTIAGSIKAYVTLLDAEKQNKINLDKNANKAAQLSSATLSLEGFGGSGNTSNDLASLLPDADEVKSQKAAEALSIFDFTKRVPKPLFSSFYSPAGTPLGVLVGWKKVTDASGYVVERTDLFTAKKTIFTVTNEDLKISAKKYRQYVEAWVLSFYDSIKFESICVFLDTSVCTDKYYMYDVQGYQMQNENPETMLSVETSSAKLSETQKKYIRSQIEILDPGTGADTISPYPLLSHVLLGDNRLDWLMAALNIRTSIKRGDSRSTTRAYSYLSSQLDFLFSQADSGKLVVPKGNDSSQVIKNIEDSISKFGTSQVIKEVLQQTGALYYFDGKDSSDNTLFKNVGASNSSNSSIISVIASAIDPENITLDVKTLSTNFPKLLTGDYSVEKKGTIESAITRAIKKSQPEEIAVPTEGGLKYNNGIDLIKQKQAEDNINFLRNFDKIAEDTIDLSTFEGISTMMRIVRIFSDIGPNKGTPIANVYSEIVPDPIQSAATTSAPVESTSSTATKSEENKTMTQQEQNVVRAQMKNNPTGNNPGSGGSIP